MRSGGGPQSVSAFTSSGVTEPPRSREEPRGATDVREPRQSCRQRTGDTVHNPFHNGCYFFFLFCLILFYFILMSCPSRSGHLVNEPIRLCSQTQRRTAAKMDESCTQVACRQWTNLVFFFLLFFFCSETAVRCVSVCGAAAAAARGSG